MDGENVGLMKTFATLLVEGKGKRYSAVIDDNTSATLFKRANGRVSIERKNSDSERAEV